MALPGHRRTSSDKRRRAAHFALKKAQYIICGNCGVAAFPHKVCGACGFYRGKQVISTGKSLANADTKPAKVEEIKTEKSEEKSLKKSEKTVKKDTKTETKVEKPEKRKENKKK